MTSRPSRPAPSPGLSLLRMGALPRVMMAAGLASFVWVVIAWAIA